MSSSDIVLEESLEELGEESYSSENIKADGSLSINDAGGGLRAISGSAYGGTIGTAYMEYFNGLIDRFPIGTNYLVYRPDRYSYRLVYGDALTESEGRFSASEANYVNIYSYDTVSVTRGKDSVNVTVGDAMVYSNLAGYPDSLKGVSHAEGLAVMACIAVLLVFNLVRSLFYNN